MSIGSLNQPKEKGSSRTRRAESMPPSTTNPIPIPRPTPTGATTAGPQPSVEKNPDLEFQFQLGNTMLQAVDRLTGMSADDIEVVASRVIDGAREIEEILRNLARKVRQNGLVANEDLAKFVGTANKCAETARAMQGMLGGAASHIPTEPSSQDTGAAKHDRTDYPIDLGALETEIEAFSTDRAPPLQTRD